VRAIAEYQYGVALGPHPHVLRYYGAWEENGYLYIQTELCKGSLKNRIDSVDLPETTIWNYILDLALVIPSK
jgi:hypothetical protein